MTIERLEPAFGGLDTDSAPDYIDKRKAPVLQNLLVDRPGKLPIRGPINDAIDLYSGALVGSIAGVWSHNNNLLIGVKAASASATRDPWVAPYRRAAVTGDLGTHYTTLYHVNLETRATTTVASATAITTPGPRYARLGANTYGISYSGTSDETVNGGLQRRTALCRWGGTAVLPTSIATTFAPSCMQDVKAHLNRLFVLGGNVPGTTGAVKPNSLYWSDIGGPTAGTLAEWQDDVSGLVNQITVDTDDSSDFGVALAKVGRALCIFKRRSMHLLLGDTPSTFTLRTFSSELGCIDPRSVVEYRDGVFFMSHQGFMFFDGQQLTNMSDDLRSSLLTDALAHVGDAGIDGGAVVAYALPNDYIGLTISHAPTASGVSHVHFSALLHAPTGAWSTLASNALGAGAPIAGGKTLSRSYLVDDQRLFDASFVTAPEGIAESRRGFDEATTVFTFDPTAAGPLFNGTGDTLKNQTTLISAWTSVVYSTIPVKWHSRLARLSEPDRKSHILRLLLDYTFQVDAAADDGGSGWYVTVVDGQGNVLLPELQVPIQGDPSTYGYHRQFVTDLGSEANDAQLKVEWRGTTPYALKDASLFGAYLEFNTTQQRRSG